MDIVYILEEEIKPDELRYSLRSVCENFPYDRVWFYGGCPDGLRPDRFVQFNQKGKTPWEKTTSTVKDICENDEISEDIWLFNDDFFINKKVTDVPYYYYDRMDRMIKGCEKNGKHQYGDANRKTRNILQRAGFDTLNYALHIPMRINREKGLAVIKRFPKASMFRSLYGNVYNVGGEERFDVKFEDNLPYNFTAMDFLSTSDESFRDGVIGRYIRERFCNTCRYEV